MGDITINPGDTPTAAQWNSYMLHTGSTFNTWTPAVTQGVAVTTSNIRSTYFRCGRLIVATFRVSCTSTGTAANPVGMTIPVTAAANGPVIGSGDILDSSAPSVNELNILLISTTGVDFRSTAPSADNRFGVAIAVTLASGDTLSGTFTYEAAAG